MPTQLPNAVAAYFEISSGPELPKLEKVFTDTAIVRDEAQKYQGPKAIFDWLIDAKQQYSYTTEIRNSKTHRDSCRVQVLVSGNFPGSPVTLDHIFQLEDERIASLEIKPCP